MTKRCFAIEFKSSTTPLVIKMPQYIPIDFINSIIQFIKQKTIHMLYMVDIMTFSSTLSCMEKKSVNFSSFLLTIVFIAFVRQITQYRFFPFWYIKSIYWSNLVRLRINRSIYIVGQTYFCWANKKKKLFKIWTLENLSARRHQ